MIYTIKNIILLFINCTVPLLFLSLVLKPFFHHGRPDLSWIHSNGMPSGHSAAAGINFWVAILIYKKGWISSQRLCIAFCFLMVSEAYSRIYLYYHTVAQVICGFSYGIICVLLLHYFIPYELAKTKQAIRVEFKRYYQQPEYDDEETYIMKKTIQR